MAGTLPTGTVTFLFTDIEGSTKLLTELGERYDDLSRLHHSLVRKAIDAHGGIEVKTEGDAFFVAFPEAASALKACADIQRDLVDASWPDGRAVRVRMGLHTGAGRVVDGDYVSIDVNRAARIASAASGGQVLVSWTTADASGIVDSSDDVGLMALGEHSFKDFPDPIPLLQLTHPELPAEFPPPRSETRARHNLPAATTPLLGRDSDVAAIAGLISDSARLVSLVGVGGIGKTRLATAAGEALIEEMAGGVWFVGLAAESDPVGIIDHIASVLGVQERAGQSLSDALIGLLAKAPTLLILDNLEQLLPDATEIVGDLLAGATSLRIIATSRERLKLGGEHVVHVEPLSDSTTIELFRQRAAAVTSFELDATNATDVALLCEQLGGVPLAVELAAARIRLFDPAGLLGRLQHGIDVLAGGAEDLLPHQRSLRATLAWSYELLDPEEQLVLQRIALFPAAAPLAGVERLVASSGGRADVVSVADRLIDRGLISSSTGASGEPLLATLEMVRQFTVDTLAASDRSDAEQELIEWAISLAERCDHDLRGPEQMAAAIALEEQLDNVRGALRLAIDNWPESALQLAASLGRFWSMKGHWSEGRRWLDEVLALRAGDDHRPKAHLMAGNLASNQGASEIAQRHFETAQGLAVQAGNGGLAALAENQLGDLARINGTPHDAYPWFDAALERTQHLDDERLRAQIISNRGATELSEGRLEQAVASYEDGLGLARRVGDRRLVAVMLMNLAEARRQLGQLKVAQDDLRHVLRVASELELRDIEARALVNLGVMATQELRSAEALDLLRGATELCRLTGDKSLLGHALYGLAQEAYADDPRGAEEMMAEAAGISKEIGHLPTLYDRLDWLAMAAEARGDATTASAYREQADAVKSSIDA